MILIQIPDLVVQQLVIPEKVKELLVEEVHPFLKDFAFPVQFKQPEVEKAQGSPRFPVLGFQALDHRDEPALLGGLLDKATLTRELLRQLLGKFFVLHDQERLALGLRAFVISAIRQQLELPLQLCVSVLGGLPILHSAGEVLVRTQEPVLLCLQK